MARFIALYLPQYHPFKENDEWWGKGFTEWVNVATARPLFRGQKQPHIPADLGFYDLRVPEVREQQAELAREAGIEGFCYYHYWFGNGKQVMQMPFNEVVRTGKPDFPFCLCWANHSWYKKLWDPNSPQKDKLLAEQTYPGDEDYINHFNTLLPAFKDKRYMKVNGKLIFYIYDAIGFKDVKHFIELWRKLAKENGLNDFYFITTDADSRLKDEKLSLGFDAINNVDAFNMHHHMSKARKVFLALGRKYFHMVTRMPYEKAMKYMIIDDCRNDGVIPSIAPNWDHTPRSKYNGFVLTGCKPDLFKNLAKRAIDIVKNKPKDEQLVFLKSWNEWGEGNYMEPDLEFGHGFIDALREAIEGK